MIERNEGDIQEVQHLTMEGTIYIPFFDSQDNNCHINMNLYLYPIPIT